MNGSRAILRGSHGHWKNVYTENLLIISKGAYGCLSIAELLSSGTIHNQKETSEW